MSQQSFEKDRYQRKKEKFLKDTSKEMQPKSYYDKHRVTVPIAKFFSRFVFSPISVVFACATMFFIALSSFGINTSLMASFGEYPVASRALLLAAVVMLAFFELGKHHYYTEGFTESYRKTDDEGWFEFRAALFFQIFSVCLSFYGGYLIANELAGTEKAATLASIEAEYKPLIEEAKAAQTAYFDANSWKGKLSNERSGEYNRLGKVAADYEAEFLNAKKEAGVGAGFVAASSIGTMKMIALLGGSQILVELFLTLCLWWIAYFKSKVAHEEGEQTSSTPSVGYRQQNSNPQFALNGNERTIVKGFAGRSTYPQTTQTTQPQKPVTVVTQEPQEEKPQKSQQETTIKAVDVSSEKKRTYEYIPRLLNSYTESNFLSIREDVKKLATAGYKVTIKSNNRAKIAKTNQTNLDVMVIWNDDKKDLIIKYAD